MNENMDATDDKRPTPDSNEFVIGYSTCMTVFESGVIPDENPERFANPFREGTDQHRGFEEAYYDLTQK